jgi:hypothetical protein
MATGAARYGTDWTTDEVAIAVAEYFFMLANEWAGRDYVKAEHRRRVEEQTGRSPGSVERKFANISAVLDEIGVPWIWGYKPYHNFQNALVEAVDRHLIQFPDVFAGGAPAPNVSTKAALDRPAEQDVFIEAPSLIAKDSAARLPSIRRLISKYDPAARDKRNRALGVAGEEFVLDYERDRLERLGCSKLAGDVRWVSQEDGDGTGYDILSFTPSGQERLLEVKTTCGHECTPFWITRRECEVAIKHEQSFRIRRVFHFRNGPQMFELQPPLEKHVSLTPTCYLAAFQS